MSKPFVSFPPRTGSPGFDIMAIMHVTPMVPCVYHFILYPSASTGFAAPRAMVATMLQMPGASNDKGFFSCSHCMFILGWWDALLHVALSQEARLNEPLPSGTSVSTRAGRKGKWRIVHLTCKASTQKWHTSISSHFSGQSKSQYHTSIQGEGKCHYMCLEEECLFLSVRIKPVMTLGLRVFKRKQEAKQCPCIWLFLLSSENNEQEVLMGAGRGHLYWLTAQIGIIHIKAPLAIPFWLSKALLLIHF